MKHAGDSRGNKSHSPALQTQLAGSHPQAAAALNRLDCRVPNNPRGKVKLGSESRCASLRVLQLVAYTSDPGFLMYAARHLQQIPDRVVESIFEETLGKYVANCKHSIVNVSDDYMVT